MHIIYSPKNLNIKTVGNIFSSIQKITKLGQKTAEMDFSTLTFADPCGIIALASILVGFQRAGFSTIFRGVHLESVAVKYMHEVGFFSTLTNYDGEIQSTRPSMILPFTAIDGTNHVNFIHTNLRPWIASEISMHVDTLDTLCACISEAFQNVEHHGGGAGFGIAQHYPKKKILQIAVADLGRGIPHHVQKVHPNMNSQQALRKACERGFTTKTNYTNRGFGLDNLILYTVKNNGGTIMLRSLDASLEAIRLKEDDSDAFIKTSHEGWLYPGSIVRITLKTDTLEQSEDAQPEEFRW